MSAGLPVRLAQLGLACIAVGVPALFGYSSTPSTTFFNQAAALIGWGLFSAFLAAVAAAHPPRTWRFGGPTLAMAGALALLVVLSLTAMRTAALPSGLAYSSAGMIGAAILVLLVADAARRAGHGDAAFEAFCSALLLAALLSTAVAFVQYFLPQFTNDTWLARPSSPGRVGGNLRQANHLSTLLLWGLAATVWLYRVWDERSLLPPALLKGLAAATLLALTFGAVLTVSRTGTVCIVLLTLWGLIDRRLPRFIRVALWVLPVVYALSWWGLTEWAQVTQHAFSGSDQLNKGDLSSSRFGIWSNTLALIRSNPWWGVGWGEFNFAWTLTPFPGRPVAFFDHTHNLPLQLAVEIGIPLTVLVLTLALGALIAAFVRLRQQDDRTRSASACALVMVAMIGVHSQLEYPLWYAYFLLPAVFALGTLLSVPEAPVRAARTASPWGGLVLVFGAVLVTAGGALALKDYLRVQAIFAPSANPAPLGERIAEGQQSVFFAHHADYAAISVAESPSAAMPSFAVAPHYLLDARLIISWSKAMYKSGDVERARYLAQRVKEFKHALGAEFFAPCSTPPTAAEPLPYQCTPPTRTFTFRDFRRR